ncbi:MAG TPA: DinB family protein [Vicinamibacteria bacterium]|nr:DinB family protein [Vicinamibacteria bacterium]
MASIGGVRSRMDRLQADRVALLDSVAGVAAERLRSPRDDGGWSILQILSHLALAEQHTLIYIHKKMQDPSKLPRAGALSFWRMAIVVAALRSPYKARAPERTAHPEADTTLAAVREHWDGVRRDWQHLVDEFPAALVDRAVFRHPRVGLVSLPHTLGFLQAHLHHHRRQIARRLA